MKYVLSIDQGTTSSRAIVFDENQKIIAESQKEYELQYPNDGWVEAKPDEILSSVKETIKEALESADVDIAACGITNQRETVIVWDRLTGKPIYPAIDVILIINPLLFFLITGSVFFIISIGPKKFVLKSDSISSILDSSTGPVYPIPALLIRTSILPSLVVT